MGVDGKYFVSIELIHVTSEQGHRVYQHTRVRKNLNAAGLSYGTLDVI